MVFYAHKEEKKDGEIPTRRMTAADNARSALPQPGLNVHPGQGGSSTAQSQHDLLGDKFHGHCHQHPANVCSHPGHPCMCRDWHPHPLSPSTLCVIFSTLVCLSLFNVGNFVDRFAHANRTIVALCALSIPLTLKRARVLTSWLRLQQQISIGDGVPVM